jgi:hypothetical protein
MDNANLEPIAEAERDAFYRIPGRDAGKVVEWRDFVEHDRDGPCTMQGKQPSLSFYPAVSVS